MVEFSAQKTRKTTKQKTWRQALVHTAFAWRPQLVDVLPAPLRQRAMWSLVRPRLEIENLAFDEKYGTDTANAVDDLTQIGVSSGLAERGTGYMALSEQKFTEIMNALLNAGVDLSRYEFIDYGSGKGKVLLLASHYSFRRVIGLEYSPDMHEIAIRNCRIYRDDRQRCHVLAPLHADALTFKPPTEPMILFLYNPFDLPTTKQVLQSLDGLQNEVIVIFVKLSGIREMMPAFKGLCRLHQSIRKQEYIVFSSKSSC
jgi:SAM-dependent methyltransferase